MNLNKLEKLAKLKEMGAITEEEFEQGKKEAMNDTPIAQQFKGNKFGLTDQNYNVLMHLSQFCSVVVPILGVIAPIVLWIMNKDTDPRVDAHGRNILNWNISLFIYFFICGLLMFVFIGFILIWIPAILMVVFPIIGALKAGSGEVWKYPFSFKFL